MDIKLSACLIHGEIGKITMSHRDFSNLIVKPNMHLARDDTDI